MNNEFFIVPVNKQINIKKEIGQNFENPGHNTSRDNNLMYIIISFKLQKSQKICWVH